MATRSESGGVDINAAFFSFTADLKLYFLSNPASAHCRNLTHVDQMAVTVFDTRQEWGKPHAGLQLYGTAGLTPPDEAEQARASYATRFTSYFDWVLRAGEASEATTGFPALHFYRFLPARIKVLDEQDFGDDVCIMTEIGR
jgi:pyridoxamine 5'-phosphate oxidase-like protein